MTAAQAQRRPLDVARRALFTPVQDLLAGRLAPRFDLDQLLRESALPGELADLVRDVLRRTRLWRAEKADVARELIAHFRDGLDAGASPRHLGETFGTPRRVARLIARAKRRNRPLWWRTLNGFGWGVIYLIGLVVILYVVQAIRLYSGEVRITHNYLAEWNAPARAVPPDERAWPLYVEAALAGEDRPTAIRHAVSPTSPHWPEIADWGRRQANVAAQIRRAASMDRLAAVLGRDTDLNRRLEQRMFPFVEHPEPEDDPLFLTVPVTPLKVLRDASDLLLVDAILALEGGDSERFMSDVVAQLGVARHARQVNYLICDLVAIGVIADALHAVETALDLTPEMLSESDLIELAHQFAAIGSAEDVSVRLDSEYASFRDFVQRYYSDDGSGGGLPRPDLLPFVMSIGGPGYVPNSYSASLLMNAISPFFADRQTVSRTYEELMGPYEAEGRKPLWQRGAARGDRALEGLGESWLASIRLMPVRILAPSQTRAMLASEFLLQRRDATLTAIALELHRRRTGEWPASLAELTPRLLPAVPLDRYDGQPLKYKLVEGRPLLYSVGVDRNDDGGRLPDAAQLDVMWHDEPNRAARKWLPVDAPDLPDGDWILWPPVEE